MIESLRDRARWDPERAEGQPGTAEGCVPIIRGGEGESGEGISLWCGGQEAEGI